MKKLASIIAVLVLSSVANANKNYQNSSRMVYYMDGENVYHTSATAARSHAMVFDRTTAKVKMQLESGCKLHRHLCPVCELFGK